MKLFIVLLSIIASAASYAKCDRRIDNKKIMIFVDTNEADEEIVTAEKAACERGQKLVIIPSNYKEYASYTKKAKAATKAYESCFKASQSDFTKCLVHIEAHENAQRELDAFKKMQPLYKDELKDLLKKMQNEKATLENFSISGHDGGGYFGGQKQGFTKVEIGRVMREYSEVNNVKSLLLLGCYTGVQKEVVDWQDIFPKMRLLGGYDGSAPLSDRPAGNNYIYDLLTKEKLMTSMADQKKLETIVIKNIRSLDQLNVAMYIKPNCQSIPDEKSFYYAKFGNGKTLRPFDVEECSKVKDELAALKLRLEKYETGEIEPPKITVSGELRQIYNKARSYGHCEAVIGDILDADKVFGLLFYQGMKQNFARHFGPEMKEAEKIFLDMDVSVMLKAADNELESLRAKKEELKLIESNPIQFVENKQKALDELQKDVELAMASPKMIELKERMMKGFSVAFSNEDQKVLSETNNNQLTLQRLKAEVFDIKNSPERFISKVKAKIASGEEYFIAEKTAALSLKVSNGNQKNIWIPSDKNLQVKSRKEMLINQNSIQDFLSNPHLPQKVRSALNWVNMRTAQHLQHLQNPFSWHEFTGTTEAPLFPMKLSDALKLTSPGSALQGGYLGSGNLGSGLNGNGGVGLGGGMTHF